MACPACCLEMFKGKPYHGFYRASDLSPVENILHMARAVKLSSFRALKVVPTAMIALTLANELSPVFDKMQAHLHAFHVDTNIPLLAKNVQFDFETGTAVEGSFESGAQFRIVSVSHVYYRCFELLCSNCIQRIVIIFTTHANPDDGGLHFSPAKNTLGFSNTVCNVLEFVFPPDLRQFVQRQNVDSSLFIMTCGAAFTVKESFDSFTHLAKCFDRMVAFPSRDMQPLDTAPFCNAFITQVLLQDGGGGGVSRTFQSICRDHPSLGAHANILVWHYKESSDGVPQLQITQGLWLHEINAPCGVRITEIMCRFCHVMRKRTVTVEQPSLHSGERRLVLTCDAGIQRCPRLYLVLTGLHARAKIGPRVPSGDWIIGPFKWGCSVYEDDFAVAPV
ncbi:hypothetical protein D9757_011678 [Collybiopsis confluens]|uniref:Uncharacterized protein n=1 Tax=Collybiopsis confluens TaxID=2823264 RepID=A0A8H5LRF4_9AGAR|nr:hypothetical protein D9757_011678 [Collybiopsis confluens]